jgi:hypothetical protein
VGRSVIKVAASGNNSNKWWQPFSSEQLTDVAAYGGNVQRDHQEGILGFGKIRRSDSDMFFKYNPEVLLRKYFGLEHFSNAAIFMTQY